MSSIQSAGAQLGAQAGILGAVLEKNLVSPEQCVAQLSGLLEGGRETLLKGLSLPAGTPDQDVYQALTKKLEDTGVAQPGKLTPTVVLLGLGSIIKGAKDGAQQFFSGFSSYQPPAPSAGSSNQYYLSGDEQKH